MKRAWSIATMMTVMLQKRLLSGSWDNLGKTRFSQNFDEEVCKKIGS